MRVVRVPKFGVENLVVGEADEPRPAGGEVLIATDAATINPSDAGIVSGAAAPCLPPRFSPPPRPPASRPGSSRRIRRAGISPAG
jgi:NADPH:quinone reductase-like Zn-dependent oxidoreductase